MAAGCLARVVTRGGHLLVVFAQARVRGPAPTMRTAAGAFSARAVLRHVSSKPRDGSTRFCWRHLAGSILRRSLSSRSMRGGHRSRAQRSDPERKGSHRRGLPLQRSEAGHRPSPVVAVRPACPRERDPHRPATRRTWRRIRQSTGGLPALPMPCKAVSRPCPLRAACRAGGCGCQPKPDGARRTASGLRAPRCRVPGVHHATRKAAGAAAIPRSGQFALRVGNQGSGATGTPSSISLRASSSFASPWMARSGTRPSCMARASAAKDRPT